MHRTLLAAGLCLFVQLACATTDRLAKNGAANILSDDTKLRWWVGNLEKNGIDVLQAVFGRLYNEQVADVIAYLPRDKKPESPVLVYAGREVRVLDREPVMWAVVLADPDVDDKCPTVGVRLTATGETRPDIGLSVDQLLSTALSRKAQERTAVDPKDEMLRTTHIAGKKSLCFGVQRLSLQTDSINRLTFRYPFEAEEKVTVVKVLNLPPPPAPQPPQEPEKPKPEELGKATVINFANSRIPSYSASVGIGSDLRNFGNKTWCTQQGGCRPGLYVFGHVFRRQFPGPPYWVPNPAVILSGALGVRLLDPALSEVVGGLRIGIGEGWPQGSIARFGAIVGLGYVFKTFENSDTAGGKGNNWRLFTALDFAF